MPKLIALPNNSDELQGKLNYLTNEIRETYPIYSALATSMKNPFMKMIISERIEKSMRIQLFFKCFSL